jgi:predicted membrane protein
MYVFFVYSKDLTCIYFCLWKMRFLCKCLYFMFESGFFLFDLDKIMILDFVLLMSYDFLWTKKDEISNLKIMIAFFFYFFNLILFILFAHTFNTWVCHYLVIYLQKKKKKAWVSYVKRKDQIYVSTERKKIKL